MTGKQYFMYFKIVFEGKETFVTAATCSMETSKSKLRQSSIPLFMTSELTLNL